MLSNVISTCDKLSLSDIPPVVLAPDGYHEAPPCYSFTRGSGNDLPSYQDAVGEFNDKLIKGYKLLYTSPESAHQAYQLGQEYSDQISSSHSDPGINMGEEDVASKLSIQRRLPPKYFAAMKTLPEGDVSADFDFCLEAYVRKVASLSEYKLADPYQLMATDSDPFDTNQGFPTFSTDPQFRFFTASALGLSKYEASHILSRLQLFVTNLGFEGFFRWPAAIAKRTGPTHKPVPVFRDAMDGYSIVATQEATGYFTRARQVFMMPFYFNILISPVALALKKGRLSIRGFNHSAEGERSYLSSFMVAKDHEIAESDLSGFDQSITPALRKRLWYWCRKYGFNSTALDLLDEFEEETVILSAPYNSQHKNEFSFVRRRSGLLSGLKVTTEVGSALSSASTLKALLRCGVLTRDQISRGDWGIFLMLGDDILLNTPQGAIDPAVFEASYAEEGLKVKYLSPGKRFLMNHIYNGKKYGVACRFIQQSAFNEDSYEHVGQLRLGLASRLSKSYFPEHWRLLQGWAKGMADIVACQEIFSIIVKSSDAPSAASTLLTDPSVDDFLSSAAGQSWIDGILSKNAISGTMAEFVSYLQSKGVTGSTNSQEQRNLLLARLFQSTPSEVSQALLTINKYLQTIQP